MKELLSCKAERIKGSCLDKVFKGTFIQFLRSKTLAEIIKEEDV